MTYHLPNDKFRCVGQTVNAGYELHPDCRECVRRTAPRYPESSYNPPATQFPCEFRIESTEAAAVLPKQLER